MKRRDAIRAGLAGATLGGMPNAKAESNSAAAFDFSSDLIYLSPQRSNGHDSTCQAEVWFVALDDALYAATATDAWRAEAIRRGLVNTRVWVGDEGQWQGSNGKYRQLPQLMATGSFETAKPQQEEVLKALSRKYRLSWLVWGPRFRKGLADGSRVMLKYSPA